MSVTHRSMPRAVHAACAACASAPIAEDQASSSNAITGDAAYMVDGLGAHPCSEYIEQKSLGGIRGAAFDLYAHGWFSAVNLLELGKASYFAEPAALAKVMARCNEDPSKLFGVVLASMTRDVLARDKDNDVVDELPISDRE